MSYSALVGYLLLFLVVGTGFILIHLLLGKIVRPRKPHAEKLTIYECGEPTVGSAWVQFDLRYYVVALLFVIFDVEVAFFFPWAVVFGQANTLSIVDEVDKTPTAEAQLAKRELLNLKEKDPEDANDKDAKEKPVTRALTKAEQDKANDIGSRLSFLALVDIAVFFGVLLVGFAYLWKRGDLQWVKTTIAERLGGQAEDVPTEFRSAQRDEVAV